MFHEDFKHLPRRTISDKILRGKVFILLSPKNDGHQLGLVAIIYESFNKTLLMLLFQVVVICKTSNYLENYTKQ